MKTTFHKRLGKKVVGYHRHFTKYLFERDTIFATLWVFIFILIAKFNPINFYFLNPVKLAFKDFDFNDLTYSKLGKGKNVVLDSNIVIVNIGHADRAELAFMIEKTAALEPKVMGVDVIFAGPKDAESDNLLREALGRHKNLVLTNRLDFENDTDVEQHGYFDSVVAHTGYANLIGNSLEEINTVRYYSSYEKEKKIRYNSFGASIVELYDPAAYARMEKRKKKQEILNFTRHTSQYRVIQGDQLLQDMIEKDYVKGKIALLAYVNEDPSDIEDKIYSPLNTRFVGKSTPDMNGIVVHANFISMVLSEGYIKKLPLWVEILVAILIGWLHMSFFIRYYLENHIWFHLVAKIAQLFSAIIFAGLGMVLFDSYNIKLDMKLTLIVIVLSVDIIYFYEAFAVWMHKKFHYHTVFHQKHH